MSYPSKGIKQWVEKDMKTGKHVYTEYKDVDGILLAEGMVLSCAWMSGKDKYRKYYVKKDIKKNKYYLQSFFEQVTHLGEYYNKEYDKVNSRGKAMEFAASNLQVELNKDYSICFLEDYGIQPGKFPARHKIINGFWYIEEVEE